MSTDPTVETDEPNQNLLHTVRSGIDELSESASVQRVFGDPITTEGKTIVPVARVAYGFGSGFGSGGAEDEGEFDGETGQGGGGGGGMSVTPVGALEVTPDGTRFVRVGDWKRAALALGVGLVAGLLLGRR
ncbi:spore germination protein GerW family protein [Halomicroarcula sp. GCM10025709]|uniref:spore germination protein GerW family protein n=1 Tax=Haloarcula TaxID=2237 RepID=UPI0024C3C497|nr:spore germination protein GerW family protein [Halomicroarcula sp. YJ-61-S]